MTSVHAVLLIANSSASFLGSLLKVAGVWSFCVLIGGGVGGSKELIKGKDKRIGQEAAKGAAKGFLIGIPLSIAAIVLLLQ
jgi:hypothetical protein